MEQFQVFKQVTLILARMLEESVGEALGRRIPVRFEHAPDLRQGDGALTLVFCHVHRRAGDHDREYEFADGGERFRNPPILLRAHYLLSAWATPPEDQVLIGAAMRTFLDRPYLEPEGMEEEKAIGYAGVPSVDLEPLGFEEQRAALAAFGMPMAPTARYSVDVRLQSGKTTPIKRVKERIMDFRKIES